MDDLRLLSGLVLVSSSLVVVVVISLPKVIFDLFRKTL